MTLDDLYTQLTTTHNFSREQALEAVESTVKLIAFKYEAELFKIFTKADIAHVNTLEVEESNAYLKSRYQEITGTSSDVLRDSITTEIITPILEDPKKYFTLNKSS